jgi:hypothetical protein
MKTKTIIKALGFFLVLNMVLPTEIFAQHDAHKQGPPPWAPANGYRAKTRQVYFPDHNFYYDVQKGVYIYLSGKNWEVSATLPSIFANVNLKTSRQVELELNTDTPQQYNEDHKVKYKRQKSKAAKNAKPKAAKQEKGKG